LGKVWWRSSPLPAPLGTAGSQGPLVPLPGWTGSERPGPPRPHRAYAGLLGPSLVSGVGASRGLHGVTTMAAELTRAGAGQWRIVVATPVAVAGGPWPRSGAGWCRRLSAAAALASRLPRVRAAAAALAGDFQRFRVLEELVGDSNRSISAGRYGELPRSNGLGVNGQRGPIH